MQGKQPKPTVYEQCIRACKDGMSLSCESGLEKMDEIIEKRKERILKRLKGEKVEELEEDEL